MSRRWERMVQKNSKEMNRKRLKTGKTPITVSTQEQMDVFKGRSWFLPTLLVACSLFFAIVSVAYYETQTLYWVTVAGYLALGVMYFLRRPYIKVGKQKLSTRRMGMDKVFGADEIESISVQPGSVAIQLKGKRTRWVLSKFQSLYDIPALAARLKKFADVNGIEYKEDAA
ncbi:hypothetical protein FE784_00325 [Paenibacillus hemerocallicola]|uniref:Methyltransferase n=1 Tax=Paenibacillus hemerocallicola TaxID=1172614 RepID=A0A5C4THK2_9BACL|nr:hypothetical protein [Paenibacillus hemerocallicola]TNJ68146.1 hypothetical protein FE784_00325 [Paenibacillus hemerocallicola]